MVNCCFVPQRSCWKIVSPESQCLTHIKCRTDLLLHPIFSSSPAKCLHGVFASTIMRKQDGSFRLYFNWVLETYLVPWEILLSLHLCDFIQHRCRLCWCMKYIYIQWGEAGHHDVSSSCRIITERIVCKVMWVIKEAGWPNTKGLDILRNRSLWNVIDGGDFCGGIFAFWVWYIVNVYLYFFIIIAIIVFFSPIIETFFKRILTLLILHWAFYWYPNKSDFCFAHNSTYIITPLSICASRWETFIFSSKSAYFEICSVVWW